jgi:hypothetical protein
MCCVVAGTSVMSACIRISAPVSWRDSSGDLGVIPTEPLALSGEFIFLLTVGLSRRVRLLVGASLG